MKSDKEPEPFQRDRGDSEEIEILEIVGLDDPDERHAEGEQAGSVDSDVYTLDLDDGDDDQDLPDPVLGERARLVRLQADFENYKKRIEREDEANRRQAAARLIDGLLPVLDNFERAVAAAPTSPEAAP